MAARASVPGAADLHAVVQASPLLAEALARLDGCGLPGWLVGAGAVAQTVWNAAHGFADGHGIADLDVVWFDAGASAADDERAVRMVEERLGCLGLRLDVKNQVRVHEWYPSVFGDRLRPYASMADAVASWPTTATALGVHCEDGVLTVFSAFGLADLFALIVRPNRVQVPRAVYEAKALRWRQLWPRLDVKDWGDGVGAEAVRVVSS